jgi:hypothetical protein
MKLGRRFSGALCVATLTVAMSVATAHAQGVGPQPSKSPSADGPPAAPLATSLTDEAKADYDSAHSLFEIGDFNGALLKFKHAFEVSSDPRLLWNMGACEKELHHYGRAVVLVERFLRDSGSRISTETRDNATGTLAALRALSSPATLTGAPEGAQVFVDDELGGVTPLATSLALDIGSHKIRVEHPEFEPFERTVDGVTGGGEISIAVSMKPLTAGRLNIIAGPGDTIAVDGKILGTERWEGNLAPGSHKLRVTAAGKTPYEADVELAPRGARSVQVSLHAESKGALWPWIVGGTALVAGAVVGGYFLFKPKDEQGPYTSGGLGTVMLPAGVRFK